VTVQLIGIDKLIIYQRDSAKLLTYQYPFTYDSLANTGYYNESP